MKENKEFIVYKITCDVNGKLYIGQTNKTIEERLQRHFNFAINDKRSKKVKFSKAIRKYWKEHFYIEEIERVSSQEELDEREFYWINHYDAVNKGYNSKSDKGKCGGDTLSDHWNKEEISRKISESKKGDKNPMRINGGLKGERNGMYGMYGGLNPYAKKCVATNSITGEIKVFDSRAEAAKYVGLKRPGNVVSRIKGYTKSEYKGWMFYDYEEYLKSQETIESVGNEKNIVE